MLTVLLPLHATPVDQPAALTPIRLLTAWSVEPFVIGPLLVFAALYLWGVWVLHRRGDRWSMARTLTFLLGGLGSAAIATMSALGTYDTVLISVHMVQHMILAMATPMFLALGAPATLALRTLPRRPRSVLVWLLHCRLAKVLTFPPLALALFVANPFILYFSPLYEMTLRSWLLHDLLHVHFVIIGALFFWPLVGVDHVPGRVPYPFRVLMLFLTMPFHAFLGVTIMSSKLLIAEDWYVSFERSWPPSPIADQYIAGGILWGSGDIVALVVMGVMFVQWFKQSQAEARREDRRLDRLEAAERRSLAEHDRPDTISPDGTQLGNQPPSTPSRTR